MTTLSPAIRQPEYYHRQYENDIQKKTQEKETSEKSYFDQAKRVALVALPFISLRPLLND